MSSSPRRHSMHAITSVFFLKASNTHAYTLVIELVLQKYRWHVHDKQSQLTSRSIIVAVDDYVTQIRSTLQRPNFVTTCLIPPLTVGILPMVYTILA